MLPDFLVLKRQIATDRTNDLRSADRSDSLASLFGQFRQHEGDQFTIVREDQTAHTNKYRKIQIEGKLKVDDLLVDGAQPMPDATLAPVSFTSERSLRR